MTDRCQCTDAMISCLQSCKRCYQHLNFSVSILDTSSASIQTSSFKDIPVMITSVSSVLASNKLFSSSTVMIPLSISPRTSSRIRRLQTRSKNLFFILLTLLKFFNLFLNLVDIPAFRISGKEHILEGEERRHFI